MNPIGCSGLLVRRWGYVALAGAVLLIGNACFVEADTVKTIDGHSYRGKISLIDQGVQLTETNGSKVGVLLSNLDAVVFAEAAEVIPGEQSLNFPWASQDIGNVGAAGGARQETNVFTIRASGIGVGQTIDGFHFVYQPMAGDAEIVAHISFLDAPFAGAQAGLMIHQTLGPESAGATVLLSPRDGSTFHHRASRKKPNPELHGPRLRAPQWLKLEKKDKFFIGSVSEDGINWKVVGGQNVVLARTRNLEDQWFIGLAVSSHTNAGSCTAMFDQVRVESHGLKADLFSDEFQTPLRSQIVPKIERPPEGEPRPVATRFTGEILPKYSERYAFSIEPKETSRLWMNGRLILSTPQSLSEPVSLTKDTPAQLKLESKGGRRGSVKLYWQSPSQSKEPVPATALRPWPSNDSTNSAVLDPHTVDISRAQSSAAGVVLKSGTLLAGSPKQVDDTTFKFQPTGQAEQTLSTLSVARLQFRSMSPQLAARIASAVPGVLLANGDFIEGEFRSFGKGRVTISSVIFGLRSFAASTEAVAVVLRPFQPAGKFVVRTNTGSAFFAEDLELSAGEVGLNEPLLGKAKLKVAELLDIRRLRGS